MSQIKKSVSATVFATNRLEALADGVFAIVMTLLVLEISIPEIAHSSLPSELPRRLIELWPKLLSYALSFILLGLFWQGHRLAFQYIKRSDNRLVWLNIFFLMFVALIPFSTSLVGDYTMEKLPFIIYMTHLIVVLIMRLIIWAYATGKYRLVGSDIDPRVVKGEKLITFGFVLSFVLVIGLSFISVAAAWYSMVLLAVFAFITQRIIR